MARRKIVQIDEAKCNGCGLCVPACAEGAIRIVDGKARLVSDVVCDGLGACLGHCPQDAIRIIEREAKPFDASSVAQHTSPGHGHPGGCPGSAAVQLRRGVLPMHETCPTSNGDAKKQSVCDEPPSRLANWPVQLHLLPPGAPYLRNAELLLTADCVPLAYADFHGRFLDNRPVAIGCPKLDDGQFYVEKLARIIRESGIRGITVIHMEVPCCTGLLRIAEAAIAAAGIDIPLHEITISIHGEILQQTQDCLQDLPAETAIPCKKPAETPRDAMPRPVNSRWSI